MGIDFRYTLQHRRHASSQQVQQAHRRQDPAGPQRHRGCRRPRVHHPHAQEGTFSLMKSTDGCDMQPHMLCALSSIGRKTETRVESNQYSRQQVYGVSFKKRAPRAIKEIRAFAENAMGTSDVRLDPQLNKKVWECGIKGVPFRLRVRISRKRNDEEDAKEKLYSYVQAVNVSNPKGLQTAVVEDA